MSERRGIRRRIYLVDRRLQVAATLQLVAVLAGICLLYVLGLRLLPDDNLETLAARETRSLLHRATAIYFTLATAILGTLAVLLETSGMGAVIDLDAIPLPRAVPLEDWCLTFPSFGFLLGVRQKDLSMVFHRLARHNIRAAEVGRATRDSLVVLKSKDREALLFDWKKDKILKS